MGSEAVWHWKSTGLRVRNPKFNLGPAPNQLCDIGQGIHLPFLDLFPRPSKNPSSPKMLESSEQDEALQKGLPGCQFKAELTVGGAGECAPA